MYHYFNKFINENASVMYTDQIKISITKKRIYYGKPPLTEDEVDELVQKKLGAARKILLEALDVFCGVKKIQDLSEEFREAIRQHSRGKSDSLFPSQRNSKGGNKGKRPLLLGSQTR